jgi:hypothetical protein
VDELSIILSLVPEKVHWLKWKRNQASEIDIMGQFLGLEKDRMCLFLGTETHIMGWMPKNMTLL